MNRIDTATLAVTHIFDGEEVVTGGPDGQTWIATCASSQLANDLVGYLRACGRPLMVPEPAAPWRRWPVPRPSIETATGAALDYYLFGVKRPAGMSDDVLRAILRNRAFADVIAMVQAYEAAT
jgi:hypothetical protein